MKKSRRLCSKVLGALLAFFVVCYVAYRHFSPTQKHWSVWSEYPVVLVRGETHLEAALYRLFQPCVVLEEAFYRVRYRGAYTPPTTSTFVEEA